MHQDPLLAHKYMSKIGISGSVYFDVLFSWVDTFPYIHDSKLDNYLLSFHYGCVIMGTMASQITSLMIIYSTTYWGADQSKHQSSASLAFVWGIHRWPVNSPHIIMLPFSCFPMRWHMARSGIGGSTTMALDTLKVEILPLCFLVYIKCHLISLSLLVRDSLKCLSWLCSFPWYHIRKLSGVNVVFL